MCCEEITCSLCDKKCEGKDHYKRHMAYHRERARARLRKKEHAPDTVLSDTRCLGCKRSFTNQTELRNHLIYRRNCSKHGPFARYLLTHCFSKLHVAPTPLENILHLTTNPFSPDDPPSQLLNRKAFNLPSVPSTGNGEKQVEQQSPNISSPPPEVADEGNPPVDQEETDWECLACSRYFSSEEDYHSHYVSRQEDPAHGLVAKYILSH